MFYTGRKEEFYTADFRDRTGGGCQEQPRRPMGWESVGFGNLRPGARDLTRPLSLPWDGGPVNTDTAAAPRSRPRAGVGKFNRNRTTEPKEPEPKPK